MFTFRLIVNVSDESSPLIILTFGFDELAENLKAQLVQSTLFSLEAEFEFQTFPLLSCVSVQEILAVREFFSPERGVLEEFDRDVRAFLKKLATRHNLREGKSRARVQMVLVKLLNVLYSLNHQTGCTELDCLYESWRAALKREISYRYALYAMRIDKHTGKVFTEAYESQYVPTDRLSICEALGEMEELLWL